MPREFLADVPRDAVKIAVVFALAFLIGLEREEHKQLDATYSFGGIRTFPLIALVSYALALMSTPLLVPWSIGFAVIGGLMLLSYHHRLESQPPRGITTEITALATYVIGGLVEHERYWIATTLAVLSVLLLELKRGLEDLTRHIASDEIVTVTKFLAISVVLLPIVPDRDLTRFQINPFKTWLVVVGVSGVSFASYVVQRLLEGRGGLILSAVLGGAYSSTVTTVVLAKRAKEESRPNLFAGSILTASGVMYARLVLLVAFFNRTLAARLAPAFAGLAVLGILAGWVVSNRPDGARAVQKQRQAPKNPLELGSAFLFAAIFVLILVLTHLAREFLGRAGLYSLAAIMGVTDVDPFILGLTQMSPLSTPLRLAVAAIVIAAASNNVIKGIYAYAFADRATGRKSLSLLFALALVGLVPLVWV